jgi:photosystem II stability/assembly factor-like uncharacterized protein
MAKTIFITIMFSVFFIFSGCSDDTTTNNTSAGSIDGKWKASEVQMVHAPNTPGHSSEMKAQLQLLGSLPAGTIGWANLNFGSSKSWNSQTIGSQSLGRIKFTNDMIGIITSQYSGYNNTWYYLTTNGGISWLPKSVTNLSYFYSISVLSASSAYVVGLSSVYNTVLLQTTDGGSNWTEKFNFNSISANINDIQFINENTGYAVGSQNICKTTNAGLNWTVQNTTVDCYYVQFINDQTGWVAGPTGGYLTSDLLKTTDGGASWITIPLSFFLYKFDFKNENLGFANGTLNNKPVILKTLDGGATWSTVINLGVDWNQGFYFVDANTGMAADGSAVVRTEDGGVTWTQEFCDYYTNLNGVYMKDSQNGIITADNGKIWQRTTTTVENCWSLAGEIENTSIANIVRSLDEIYFAGGGYVINDGNITFTVLGYSATGGDIDDHTIGGGMFTSSGNLVLTLNFANDEQWKVTFIR